MFVRVEMCTPHNHPPHLSFRGKAHPDEVREHGPLSARLRWRRRALRHKRFPVVGFVPGNAVVAARLLRQPTENKLCVCRC